VADLATARAVAHEIMAQALTAAKPEPLFTPEPSAPAPATHWTGNRPAPAAPPDLHEQRVARWAEDVSRPCPRRPKPAKKLRPSKPKRKDEVMDQRKCAYDKCGVMFTPSHPLQKYHTKRCSSNDWYHKNRAVGAPKKAKPAANIPTQRKPAKNGKPHAGGAKGVATICVSEERLNHFLTHLPLELKAEIASEYYLMIEEP